VGVHLSLAATGFAIWIVYLVHGGLAYAVAALCLLAPVATIGFTMFGIWLVHRVSGPSEGSRPVDQRLPVTIIALHGLFAAATVVLVALEVITVAD
jgi:hypothetical protein